MEVKKIAVIYNQRAGSLIHNQDQSFEEFLNQFFGDVPEIDATPIAFDPDHLTEIQEKIRSHHCLELWVAGGDGTVLTMSDIARTLNLPMGLLPAGTLNLMARDLGMELDLTQALSQLREATPVPVDMAELNGHRFLCISNVGMCTRLTEEKEKMREVNPIIKWTRLAIETFRFAFIHPSFRVQLEADGQSYQLKTRAFSVTNNPLTSAPGVVPERSVLDSGYLGVYVSKDVSIWALPRLVIRYFNGSWKQDADLLSLHASDLKVHFKGNKQKRVMIDGERFMLQPPLHYRSHPSSIRLLRPTTKDNSEYNDS